MSLLLQFDFEGLVRINNDLELKISIFYASLNTNYQERIINYQ